MADRMLNMTAGPQTMELGGGRRLRLLTAMEVLEARREAADLAADHRERALCANACLLARALEREPFGAETVELCRITAERCRRTALSWGPQRHPSKAAKHPFSDRCFTVWAPLSQRDRASTRPSSWM